MSFVKRVASIQATREWLQQYLILISCLGSYRLFISHQIFHAPLVLAVGNSRGLGLGRILLFCKFDLLVGLHSSSNFSPTKLARRFGLSWLRSAFIA